MAHIQDALLFPELVQDGSGPRRKKTKKMDLKKLDEKEIKKIKSMASTDELNIFYDRNKIIVALCEKLLYYMDK